MLRSATFRIAILVAVNVAIMPAVFLSTGSSGGARPAVTSADAFAGQRLWQAGGCISCHSLYGLGGHIGPDLTNAAARVDDDAMRAILRYGAGRMPPQQLTESETDGLIAYLRYIDSTGVYPTGSFPGHAFGRSGED